MDDGGGGLICTIFTMGKPEMVTFWRKKLASYMYEGYASKSALPAGLGLTAKRIGVLVQDLLAAIEGGVDVVVISDQIVFLVPLFRSRRFRSSAVEVDVPC